MGQPVVQRKRQPELDVIRIFAFCGIVWLHCLNYTGFYTLSPDTTGYLPALTVRTMLSAAVPLFIMLTGYLLCEKSVPDRPLKGLGKILLIYVLTCIPSYFFRQIEEEGYYLSPAGILWTILDYSLNHYGWYVGMYIGLYLLAPYLNILHRGLDRQGNRRLLMLLFVLIALPTLTNTMHFFSLEFWRHPSTAGPGTYNRLLPEFWQKLPYPLLYYGMGAYVKHYPPRTRARTLLGLFLGAGILFSVYNLWRLDGRTYYADSWSDLYGFQATVLTPLAFCLLERFFAGRIRRKKTVRLLTRISGLVLGASLLSYCSDMILYRVLNLADRFSSFQQALLFSPLLVLASALLALLMSAPVTGLVQAAVGRFSRKTERK